MRTIYLDYNCTTPIAPRVQEAMLPLLAEQFGFPLSDHAMGRTAALAVEDARTRIAQAIGASHDEIYFTPSATASNELAVQIATGSGHPKSSTGNRLVTTSLEHISLHRALAKRKRRGFKVVAVGCDSGGHVHPDHFADLIDEKVRLVSVMHANNELGTIQPVVEITEAFRDKVRDRGILSHTDAAQSFGKIPVDVDALGVDMLTLTAHKCYGPKGIGALYVRSGTPIGPGIFREGAEHGLLPGMPNMAAIVGMGHAAELATASLGESMARMRGLRDRLLSALQDVLQENIQVLGDGARLPNTLCVNFIGTPVEQLLQQTPELCAAKCATTSKGKTQLSPTLQTLGLDPEETQGTIRLSVGWYTEEEEVDRAASLLIDAWERVGGEG